MDTSKGQQKTKRVAVFIDGSNLHYKLKDLGIRNLSYFQYGEFALWLAAERLLVAKRYYVGVVRAKDDDERGQKLRRNQKRLFNHLSSKRCGFLIERGYIMHNDGQYYEKGVDVKIAVDIVVGAYEDAYDTAVLVSSDTDLIPAIERARILGKKVEYIGFSHKPSFGLIKNSNETRLLTRNDLENFQSEERI